MDINANIIRAIYSIGFEKPSSIQRKSIPPIMQGRDVIAQSEAGSGKTAAYMIGLMTRINL